MNIRAVSRPIVIVENRRDTGGKPDQQRHKHKLQVENRADGRDTFFADDRHHLQIKQGCGDRAGKARHHLRRAVSHRQQQFFSLPNRFFEMQQALFIEEHAQRNQPADKHARHRSIARACQSEIKDADQQKIQTDIDAARCHRQPQPHVRSVRCHQKSLE